MAKLPPPADNPSSRHAPPANDTIVAISTPPGRGGIGIIRLSGPNAVTIATKLVRLRNPLAHAQARFAEILDTPSIPVPPTGPDKAGAPYIAGPFPGMCGIEPNSTPNTALPRTPLSTATTHDPPDPNTPTTIDQAIVTWFAAPNSYTGEDLVEIAAHGSPVVLELLIRHALTHGATLAEPGEFTQRAFLSGRIDLTQAEAVRDLIDAQTLYQVRVAARQLDGALSRRVSPIKRDLVELIALLEAGIDFAEDDIDVAPDSQILARIAAVREQLEPIAASFAHGRIVHAGLTLAIIGHPNVGKSSLFNRLVERERAIVTATPGTTRDLVTERVSLGGIPIELIDTAGLRESDDEAEFLGIQKSRETLAEADIVLLVLDATAPITPDHTALIESLNNRTVLIVNNKSDLVAATGVNDGRADLASSTHSIAPTIETSALNGQGIPELRQRLLDLVRGANAEQAPAMLTNLRQHNAVTATLESLAASTAAVTHRTPHEMLLLDLYSALRNLDSLTGETTSDHILNLIFSTFCIGK